MCGIVGDVTVHVLVVVLNGFFWEILSSLHSVFGEEA